MVPLISRFRWIIPCILLVALFVIACQEKIFTDSVDCKDCFAQKPDSVDLILNITLNKEFDTIPVVLYQGNIDNGHLIDTFDCFGNPAYIWVKANEEYSAKAIYATPEKTIIAVDGTKQKLKHVTSACDNNPCWVIEGVKLSLELKH